MPDDVTNNLLKTLQGQLGARWDALSVPDRELIAEVAADATGLQLAAASTDPNDAAAVAALDRETAQINAQLANVRSVAATEVKGAFWSAFTAVGAVALKIGLAAVGVNPTAVASLGEAVAMLVGSAGAPAVVDAGPAFDPAGDTEVPPPIGP